ncbi:glutathione S-transferase [Chitinimonas prasina]|uniref:Glutathione S-transferase n=1 Tax=Chitinimonas prasina TaxID=1434937 RepID=A0ABQ5YD55_9NEIS|nr:glutathione S-transferase family protein [Chitinimonas prasina]GLR11824.1 glutathione S-transferase [Chitinimonas prasina]
MQLVIGNKAYSSWSLRPWLLLKQAGIPFEEIVIPLQQAGSHEAILRYAPTGKVPCLLEGPIHVWESLAICEYLAERFAEQPFWPSNPAQRAEARSLAAEMHAGFAALRQHYPMNVRRQVPPSARPPEVERDITRFAALIESLRSRHAAAGPFLMGEFGILDAMYAPVATRCHTYSIALPARAQAWVDHILALPAMREWYAAAAAEPWVIEASEPKSL